MNVSIVPFSCFCDGHCLLFLPLQWIQYASCSLVSNWHTTSPPIVPLATHLTSLCLVRCLPLCQVPRLRHLCQRTHQRLKYQSMCSTCSSKCPYCKRLPQVCTKSIGKRCQNQPLLSLCSSLVPWLCCTILIVVSCLCKEQGHIWFCPARVRLLSCRIWPLVSLWKNISLM